MNTAFELIQGETPIAVPLSFEHMKFPAIEEKMKQLIENREEALATHKLQQGGQIYLHHSSEDNKYGSTPGT